MIHSVMRKYHLSSQRYVRGDVESYRSRIQASKSGIKNLWHDLSWRKRFLFSPLFLWQRVRLYLYTLDYRLCCYVISAPAERLKALQEQYPTVTAAIVNLAVQHLEISICGGARRALSRIETVQDLDKFLRQHRERLKKAFDLNVEFTVRVESKDDDWQDYVDYDDLVELMEELRPKANRFDDEPSEIFGVDLKNYSNAEKLKSLIESNHWV